LLLSLFKALALIGALAALLPRVVLAEPGQAPRPYVVAIAPGHGGTDPGAIFPPNASRPLVMEKDLTLPIALKLRDRLQTQAVQVVLTRTDDRTTTAEQRARLAERAGANVFVAIHVNSFYPDASVRGVEAQWLSDPDLADNIAGGLASALRSFDETVRTTKDREEDNILSMPGVIVEAGYLSNAADRELLQTAAFQDAIAEGVYQGILKYAPQIPDLKAQLEASRAAAPAPGLVPKPLPKAATPGWVGAAAIGGALGLALLAARRTRRRRRPSRYTVVRIR